MEKLLASFINRFPDKFSFMLLSVAISSINCSGFTSSLKSTLSHLIPL